MGRMGEFLMANVLTQSITEPTRLTSLTCSLIEVLITSTPELASVLSTSFSDHLPIFGVLNVPTVRPTEH